MLQLGAYKEIPLHVGIVLVGVANKQACVLRHERTPKTGLVQIISYTVLLVKSPKRSIDNVCQASVTFQSMEGTLCDIDTKNGGVPVEAVYDGTEAVYTISSIAVTNFLVVIFAAGDLRGAIALLQTWTPYNVALGLGILTSD